MLHQCLVKQIVATGQWKLKTDPSQLHMEQMDFNFKRWKHNHRSIGLILIIF